MGDQLTQTPRSRLSRPERRSQLIELGVRMLSTRTLDELSVDDISEAAGISRGLLFHYFATKQDFQVAVVEAAAARLLEVTRPDPALDPAGQLQQSLSTYIRYLMANPAIYLSLVRGAASANPQLQAVFDRTRDELAQRVSERWVTMGVSVSPLQRIAIRGWVALVEDAAMTWITTYADEVDQDDLLQMLSQQLVHILLRTPGSERRP
jgi:AcrR family transcriptional regulator